ncbi:MAG: MscL family protein, partial [Caldilineaceae bacterium]|nr:MscL family protein [Caldilineaceae bacterium]
ITVGESQILYGNFIQAIINFLIIAISMFFVVKGANSMVKKQEAAPAPPPAPTAEEKLLTQIRDILQEQAGTGR